MFLYYLIWFSFQWPLNSCLSLCHVLRNWACFWRNLWEDLGLKHVDCKTCKLVPTCCGESWRRPATLWFVTITPNPMPLERVLSELTFTLFCNCSSLVAAFALNVKTHSRWIRGLKKTQPINQAANCYGSHYPLLTSAICLNEFLMPRAVSIFSTSQLGSTSSQWLSRLTQGVFDV